MQRKNFADLRFRILGASIVALTPQTLSPRYTLSRSDLCFTSSTGHLELFRVEPVHTGLPTYSARWDQKANTVDVDLLGETAERRAFKMGICGFRGHHAAVASDSPRIYEINIYSPEELVFNGLLALIVNMGLML